MSVPFDSTRFLHYVRQGTDYVLLYKTLEYMSKIGDLATLKLLSIQNQNTTIQTSCFEYACEHGHKHIVIFFLDYLKKQFQFPGQQRLIQYCQRGFLSASKGGYLEIVQIIVEHHEPCEDDVRVAFKEACSSGSWDIILYLREKFNTYPIQALQVACQGKQRKVVDWLIENGADNWNDGLIGSCQSGDVSLMKLMIQRGATDVCLGLQITCERGHVEASKYLLELLHRVIPSNIHFQFISSAKIKKLLIECDEAHTMHICVLDVWPLINEGVPLEKLLLYKNANYIRRMVRLVLDLFELIHSSLQEMLCSDLRNVLQQFVGHESNINALASLFLETVV